MTRLPFAGVRVLDFSWVHAGPTCGMILAEYGADVLKIESSKRYDIVRRLPPMADNVFGINRSGYFNSVNRGKRSVELNISEPEGRDLALTLAKTADVVLENYSVGVMDKLGLGYDALTQVNPDIIMVSISGYGRGGPDSSYVAYGPPLTAFTGLVQVHGYEGGEPNAAGAAWPDPVAGFTAAMAAAMALWHRAETGQGQYVEISQAETVISLLGDQVTEASMNGRQPPRRGNREPGISPHNAYRSAEYDRWVAIAAYTNDEWDRLKGVVKNSALDNPAYDTPEGRWEHRDAIDEAIEAWTTTKRADELFHLLQRNKVPASIANTVVDIFSDDHLREREFFRSDDHPEIGVRRIQGLPWKFSNFPRSRDIASPVFGNGTDYTYYDLLALPAGEIARLKAANVIV